MSEFIFMLTHHDTTVPDALAVYDEVRDTTLRHVGFKDVGATIDTLAQLTRRMRADGRTVYLEVVSVSADDELRSIRAAAELGVDVVMGGTHAPEAIEILGPTAVRYFPFPGRVIGHPSVLEGTVEEIAGSAAELASIDGVHGLDLLAWRHVPPVEPIIAAVVEACPKPIVVAGTIADEERIRSVTELGAWGFTIGGAVIERALPAGDTIREQVEWALAAAERAMAAPGRR